MEEFNSAIFRSFIAIFGLFPLLLPLPWKFFCQANALGQRRLSKPENIFLQRSVQCRPLSPCSHCKVKAHPILQLNTQSLSKISRLPDFHPEELVLLALSAVNCPDFAATVTNFCPLIYPGQNERKMLLTVPVVILTAGSVISFSSGSHATSLAVFFDLWSLT